MKIVHINENDTFGGAARATYSIHSSLLKEGIESRLIVANKYRDDPSVLGPDTHMERLRVTWLRRLNKLQLRKYPHRKRAKFSINARPYFDYQKYKAVIAGADIISLYWVEDSFVNFNMLRKMRKKTVWRLSDLAPMTGGCHYPGDCERFTSHCGRCPVLGSSKEKDVSWSQLKQKQGIIDSLDVTLVAPSNWAAEQARGSSLFKNKPITIIHTGVDTDHFYPDDKAKARAYFDLPQRGNLILFGAQSSASDPRKGADLMIETLSHLRHKEVTFELVVFGNKSNNMSFPSHHRIHFLGMLNTEESLRTAYNCADVFLCPSREDNLPNTVLEAMACGVPCAAFNVGGMRDLIRHQESGFLATPFDCEEFASGIANLLHRAMMSSDLRENAMRHIWQGFTVDEQTHGFLKLYRKLVESSG